MIVVRTYVPADYPALLAVQRACFPPPFPEALLWSQAQVDSHCRIFSDGAMCAVEDGIICGSSTALIIRFDPSHPQHTWSEVSGDGYITGHDPSGDTLYGIDIAVRPESRGRGVARALYQARYALVRRLGLRRFLAGSRISGYRAHSDRMSPEVYVNEVVAGRMSDPVITPQLRSGLRPIGVVRNYLPDHDSCDNAVLMAWET
jgi:GNAT superfamily N-acetyltransferase